MKTKNIMAAHELRMWIGQVIVPVITGTAVLATNPQVKQWVSQKKCEFQSKWNSVLKK